MASTKRTDDRPKLRSSHHATSGTGTKQDAPKKRAIARSAGKTAVKRPAAKTVAKTTRAAVPTPQRRESIAPRPTKADGPRSKRKPSLAPPSNSVASDGARQMAIEIATAALEKKALGLEILDVAGRVDYADFLVLMSGRSDRQVAALAQSIEEHLKRKGKRALSVEGMPHATWVLMDFGDVVVHVFQEDSRSVYDLEGLWLDARRIALPEDTQ